MVRWEPAWPSAAVDSGGSWDMSHTLPAQQLGFGEELGFRNDPFNGSLSKKPQGNRVNGNHFSCVQHYWNLCCCGNSASPWLITRAVVVWVSLLILKGSVVSLPWGPEGNSFKNSLLADWLITAPDGHLENIKLLESPSWDSSPD